LAAQQAIKHEPGGLSMGEFTVRLSNVTKQYGDFVAVGDLSFEVPTGVVYGILGPNGAGKTTTLRMINDILLPDQGEIELLGGLAPGHEAAKRIGYLPEERGLYPKMKVSEALAFFGELRGLRRKAAFAQARVWLDRLKISDWAQNKVQDLSKGMQQKVQFAAALIHDPELLILDEPWSGLDPINADVLKDIVLAQREAGRTILFSTHLMEQAEQICDSVCIIARGRKAVEGRLADLKQEAADDKIISLRFSGAEEQSRAQTGAIADDFFATVKAKNDGLEVQLKSAKTTDQLLAALMEAKFTLRGFEHLEPSLHQIFVDKVGEQADNAVAPRSAQGGAHE
jgi:ABC-2 type transport system ATP-binding protein